MYAALFAAYAYKFEKFEINGETFEFDKHFRERGMQDYKEISKTKNLRFFTLLLKELLNGSNENLADQEIINRFKMLYNVNVLILDEKAESMIGATSEDLVLILHVNPD